MHSNSAKMEATVETLETVTNVFVPRATKEAIVKKKSTNANPIRARMARHAAISSVPTNANVRKVSKARIANTTSTTAYRTRVKIMVSAMTSSTISNVPVLMAPLVFFVKSTSTTVSRELAIMVEPVSIKLVDTNVNVPPVMSVPDAKVMSTSACPIPVPLWAHKSASSWSTITTVFVVPDGWAAIVRPGETFVRAILVKMVEFAPTRRVLIIVLARWDTLGTIANLLEHHAIARLAEMEEPASIPMTEQTLDAAVRPARRVKLVNKILATNALTIHARTVIALTK